MTSFSTGATFAPGSSLGGLIVVGVHPRRIGAANNAMHERRTTRIDERSVRYECVRMETSCSVDAHRTSDSRSVSDQSWKFADEPSREPDAGGIRSTRGDP